MGESYRKTGYCRYNQNPEYGHGGVNWMMCPGMSNQKKGKEYEYRIYKGNYCTYIDTG